VESQATFRFTLRRVVAFAADVWINLTDLHSDQFEPTGEPRPGKCVLADRSADRPPGRSAAADRNAARVVKDLVGQGRISSGRGPGRCFRPPDEESTALRAFLGAIWATAKN